MQSTTRGADHRLQYCWSVHAVDDEGSGTSRFGAGPHTLTDDVILAGVAHNNPNHDPGWGPFFAALVLIAGCAIVLAGGVVSIGMWRLEGRKKWGDRAVGR